MRRLIALAVFFFLLSSSTPTAIAKRKAPKLNVNCGQIVGLVDQNGTYGLFEPEVSVSYYGSPLTVTSYFYRTPNTKKSDTGKYIIKFTNKAPSSRFFTSQVDVNIRFFNSVNHKLDT